MADYNEMQDWELAWDDEVSNDGGFVLLTEGDYTYTVKKFERNRYEGSSKVQPCRMALLTIEVDGGSQGVATITHRLFMLSRFQWKIAEFFISAGLADPDAETFRMQWDKVVGATGHCHVVQHEYIKQSGRNAGEKGTSNEIARFLPPEPPKAAAEPDWEQKGLF